MKNYDLFSTFMPWRESGKSEKKKVAWRESGVDHINFFKLLFSYDKPKVPFLQEHLKPDRNEASNEQIPPF